MSYVKKLAPVGVAALAVTTLTLAQPTSALVSSQMPKLPIKMTDTKNQIVRLAQLGNAAVDVSTDVSCAHHILTAHVTNKTDKTIMPTVTFAHGDKPSGGPTTGIEPGKTMDYSYYYSGNNVLTDVTVAVDTFDPLTLLPMINCTEPVSFSVNQTSKSAVTGMLTNNSSFVPETVFTRVDSGDVHIETLQPGESRLIALPFTPLSNDIKTALVAIGTGNGYEGTYMVDLDKPMLPPPLQ